jgi:predicted cation transporter
MARFRFIAVVLIATMGIAGVSFAAPIPSKTAADQTVAARQADLAAVQAVTGNEQVASALAAQGFSTEQINGRLASLSAQDLHTLAGNLDQIQAAGVTKNQWILIGIGALAAAILIAAIK